MGFFSVVATLENVSPGAQELHGLEKTQSALKVQLQMLEEYECTYLIAEEILWIASYLQKISLSIFSAWSQ